MSAKDFLFYDDENDGLESFLQQVNGNSYQGQEKDGK
jgi:hypothetical protein